MPWVRHIVDQPPPAQQMEQWEQEGWTVIQILGPCPAIENSPGAKPRMVYVIYLHRSVIVAAKGSTLGLAN